jgi:hypothetical protein
MTKRIRIIHTKWSAFDKAWPIYKRQNPLRSNAFA